MQECDHRKFVKTEQYLPKPMVASLRSVTGKVQENQLYSVPLPTSFKDHTRETQTTSMQLIPSQQDQGTLFKNADSAKICHAWFLKANGRDSPRADPTIFVSESDFRLNVPSFCDVMKTEKSVFLSALPTNSP